MLRINLLPAYIAERRLTRITWILTGIGVAAVVGGFLGYHFGKVVPDADKARADYEEANRLATEVEALQKQAKDTLDQVQPLQTKVDFVKGVQSFNLLTPEIYRNAAKYTYKRVEYNSMNVSGDTLTINGFVQDLSDVGRFYLTLFANPDIRALSIRGMPGWPNAASQNVPLPGQGQPDPNRQGFPLSVTAQLVNAVVPPAYNGVTGGGNGGGGGRFGGGGMMPGMGGSMMMPPGAGRPMAGAPAAAGGGTPGASVD